MSDPIDGAPSQDAQSHQTSQLILDFATATNSTSPHGGTKEDPINEPANPLAISPGRMDAPSSSILAPAGIRAPRHRSHIALVEPSGSSQQLLPPGPLFESLFSGESGSRHATPPSMHIHSSPGDSQSSLYDSRAGSTSHDPPLHYLPSATGETPLSHRSECSSRPSSGSHSRIGSHRSSNAGSSGTSRSSSEVVLT